MFFKQPRLAPRPPVAKRIEIFARHCAGSKISLHKERPLHFSREKCFQNLLSTLDPARANLTCLLDAPVDAPHFLDGRAQVLRFERGSEAGAFLYLLDHLEALSLLPETIIYVVEDDYLHREGWMDILFEGFSIPDADYVTLYDHRDKYFDPMYRKLSSKLYATASCHWRTTPSTTHTFAVRAQTLGVLPIRSI